MNEVTININDNVKVKLTKEGIEALINNRIETRKLILDKLNVDIGISYKVDSEGYYTTQLWKLIDEFKYFMNIGSVTVFEKNELIFY